MGKHGAVVTSLSTFGPGAVGSCVKSEFIFESSPFASCHASTIVQSAHGISAAWFGGSQEGEADVGIWFSRRRASRWTIPIEIASGEIGQVRYACFNPVLFQAPGTDLLLFYKAGLHPTSWRAFLKRSGDGGITWSRAAPLPDGFIGPDKNKPLWLNGSLLCGTSIEDHRWRVRFERTSDLGKTWEQASLVDDRSEIDAIQPSILRCSSNRLLALGRTRQHRIFQIISDDDGRTWGPMILTNMPNPNSGTDAVTLRDGRHLLVYNHATMQRTPLNIAVSHNGIDWKPSIVLESGPGEFSYPACIQSADGKIHITYTWNRLGIRHVILDPYDV
jgi:predicted neuraminidase